jgi:2-(1,2-epoxy-1,2-dihydrophenyl)acetyl-CoA isomerase
MTTEAEQPILYRRDGDVAIISLNRPASLNALTFPMLTDLKEAFARAEADGARAVLLRGEGRGFCSGADLVSMGGLPDDLGELLLTYYEPVVRQMAALSVPIVCAAQGAVAGAGCAIALAADLVVADSSAYFLLAFANIGLVPDAGGTWVVAKALGRARAMEMALLGDRVPADQALAWGLINRVVAEGTQDEEALALARRLAAGPSKALGMIRKAVNLAVDEGIETVLATEAVNQRAAGRTADAREAIQAFAQKRKPQFIGA